MPTDAESIARIKNQTLAAIAEITAGPKPTYQIDGQNISWTEYLAELRATVAWCDQQLTAAAPREVRSQAYS